MTSGASQINTVVQMLGQGDAASLISLASNLIKIEQMEGEPGWRLGGNVKVWFDEADVDGQGRMHVAVDDNEIAITLLKEATPASASSWSKLEQVTIDRNGMEVQFSRGIRRSWEVLWPLRELTQPKSIAKKTAHGELKYVARPTTCHPFWYTRSNRYRSRRIVKGRVTRCIDSGAQCLWNCPNRRYGSMVSTRSCGGLCTIAAVYP